MKAWRIVAAAKQHQPRNNGKQHQAASSENGISKAAKKRNQEALK